MTEVPFRLSTLRGPLRWFFAAFLVAMAFGYLTGLYFVRDTTHMTATGTVEQFRGNEDAAMAEGERLDDAGTPAEIKFAKATPELLTIIHTHVTSYALIFLGVGLVFLGSSAPPRLKSLLAVEPFVGTVVLFGAMAALRYLGPVWSQPLAWVMMLAGMATTVAFVVMTAWSLWDLWRPRLPA